MIANITFLCVYLVEGITAWQYFNTAFTRKRYTPYAIALFVLGYISAFLLFQLPTVWLNVTYFLVLNVFLLKHLYTCSWKKCIFHVMILTGLMLGSELLVNYFLGSIFGGAEKYQTSLPILVILGVLSKFLYYVSTKICLRMSHPSSNDLPDAGPTALLMCSFSFSTIFILVIMAYLTLYNNLSSRMDTLLSVGALILLLSDLAIFAGYQYNQKLNKENLDLQLMKQKNRVESEYFKALEDQYERQRVLLHDLRRHLTAIKEFAVDNEDQQVVRYVSGLEELPALQRKVQYCGNVMLNVVLSRYKELCDENGIQFSIDVRDVDVDFLAQNDITSLFGNLLENAVEAAQNAETPYLELVIGSNGDTHSDAKLFVSLANSCFEPPLEDGIGGFITRKANKERHGVGQKSIQRAVTKYDGSIDQYYDPETCLFHTSILFQESIL